MAANLYPLIYKSGIKRDGTSFQPEYCTDGQWVRFQRGKIKKIGGMVGGHYLGNSELLTSNITMLPNENNDNIYTYIASTTGVRAFIITQSFGGATGERNFINAFNNPDALWQSEIVINPADNQKYIVYLATNNGRNIADSSAARFFTGRVYSPNEFEENGVAIDQLSNGGLCYSNPYLFIYGSNGIVQYSKSNNPFDFTINNDPASGGRLNISSDKVIYGRPIRGGANSPSILFWTLSSVVRITNVGDQNVQFKIDVISKSSSILSSRCVVEYDGIFFWPGTERFFVYNGIVTEVANLTNLNFFYDSIDMNYRQKVFGIKNPRFGEIWWFYPEKGQNPNAPGGIRNTRAIIYNKNENSWYDVRISKDSGVYSEEFGIFVTYGKSITRPNELNTYLLKHENLDCFENIKFGSSIFSNVIPSYFKTPTISWAAFNPTNQLTGIDRWMELKRIEPDFRVLDIRRFLDSFDDFTVIINTKEYAQSIEVSTQPINFSGGSDPNLEEVITTKIDFAVQGRHMNFTFNLTNGSLAEVGNIMLLLSIGDGK